MTDFDYKKYSLDKLNEWMHDVMSGDASPQEIYDCIHKVVSEDYYYHKHHISRAYELLALLKGNGVGYISNEYKEVDNSDITKNGIYFCADSTEDMPWKEWSNIKLECDKDDPSPECQNAWNDFWEEKYYPEEYKGSTVSSVQYTDEEIDAMCDKAASDQEKEQCREYNLREAEYYDKRARLDAKKDKVIKWQLPVEVDGPSGEYYVNFPDDLMEAANLKEGDQVEWIDQGDGSFMLGKVFKPLEVHEC